MNLPRSLRAGADPQALDADRATPLHKACAAGHAAAALTLLEAADAARSGRPQNTVTVRFLFSWIRPYMDGSIQLQGGGGNFVYNSYYVIT